MQATAAVSLRGKNTSANITYMGSLALHDIKGIIAIVSFLSLSEDRREAAIMAGTEQPNPEIIGIMASPGRPKNLIGRFIIYAALYIYPLSSRVERKKNRVPMVGMKASTLPIPVHKPSITRE